MVEFQKDIVKIIKTLKKLLTFGLTVKKVMKKRRFNKQTVLFYFARKQIKFGKIYNA